MPAMGNYTNAMAEKILLDIANVFSKDDLLEEFDILPVETNNCNRSPVLHAEHSLGLEGWCMKNVYHYCYNVLMEQYISKANNKPIKINMDNCEEVNRLLMGALLINPDVATFWNKRREMYSKRFLKFFDEMKFTKVLLSRKSKCNDAFAYRKWLLERYWSEPVGNQCLRIAATAEAELSVTHSCAQKSPNNYHAWTHRIWFMKQMAKHTSPGICLYLFMGELKFSELWISTNVSDHSGLHYRQFALNSASLTKKGFTFLEGEELSKYTNSINEIMKNLSNFEEFTTNSEREIMVSILGTILEVEVEVEDSEESKVYGEFYQRICFVLYDLLLNEELIKIYTSHEALWCHRKFIMSTFLNVICQYFGEGEFKSSGLLNVGKEFSSNITSFVMVCEDMEMGEPVVKEAKVLRHHHHSVYSSPLYKAFSLNEKKFIDQRSKCGDTFALKFHKWLRFVLGFTI